MSFYILWRLQIIILLVIFIFQITTYEQIRIFNLCKGFKKLSNFPFSFFLLLFICIMKSFNDKAINPTIIGTYLNELWPKFSMSNRSETWPNEYLSLNKLINYSTLTKNKMLHVQMNVTFRRGRSVLPFIYSLTLLCSAFKLVYIVDDCAIKGRRKKRTGKLSRLLFGLFVNWPTTKWIWNKTK